jgi:hypothetical protein
VNELKTTAAPTESQTPASEQSGSGGNAKSRISTGPRTELGKQSASRNATKHGIFSRVIVLPGERRADYERLLAELRQTRQPEGALEEYLVEKLATNIWRQRRLFSAEGGEIRKYSEYEQFDELKSLGIYNPLSLEATIEEMTTVREEIAAVDFNPEQAKKIHSARGDNRYRDKLYDFYRDFQRTSECSEEERKKVILDYINKIINELKSKQASRSIIEAQRAQIEKVRHNVPDAHGLDRLLRYGAALERDFDRTLHQLVSLQRMRLGQPVLKLH